MLSDEGKQRLFTRAHDDEERQRLMVALWSDSKTDAMRGFGVAGPPSRRSIPT